MSSVAGEILIDLAVQYVVPYLIRKATSRATRQASGKKPGPGSPGHAQPVPLRLLPTTAPSATAVVISRTPGRVRLRVAGLRGDGSREATLAEHLGDLPGVRLVQANRLTGTVLVEYNPETIGLKDILTALESFRSSSRYAKVVLSTPLANLTEGIVMLTAGETRPA